MDDLVNKLTQWEDSAREVTLAEWESLPEIELYMDQVITYIEKQLALFQQVEEVKLITPSMINNYVKDGVIKHAVQKKYNKEHVASLIITGLLKQVLPISKVSTLLSSGMDTEKLYRLFCGEQKQALSAALDKISGAAETINAENGTEKLLALALSLSAQAFANRIAAEKLINIALAGNNPEKPHDDKNAAGGGPNPPKAENEESAAAKQELIKQQKRERKLKKKQEKEKLMSQKKLAASGGKCR